MITYPAPNIAAPMLSTPQPHPRSATTLFSISSNVLWIVYSMHAKNNKKQIEQH